MSFKKGFILAFIAVFAALTCGAALAVNVAADDSANDDVVSIVEEESDLVWWRGKKKPVTIVIRRPAQAKFTSAGSYNADGDYEEWDSADYSYTVGDVPSTAPDPTPTSSPSPSPTPSPSPVPAPLELTVTAEPSSIKAADTGLKLTISAGDGIDLPDSNIEVSVESVESGAALELTTKSLATPETYIPVVLGLEKADFEAMKAIPGDIVLKVTLTPTDGSKVLSADVKISGGMATAMVVDVDPKSGTKPYKAGDQPTWDPFESVVTVTVSGNDGKLLPAGGTLSIAGATNSDPVSNISTWDPSDYNTVSADKVVGTTGEKVSFTGEGTYEYTVSLKDGDNALLPDAEFTITIDKESAPATSALSFIAADDAANDDVKDTVSRSFEGYNKWMDNKTLSGFGYENNGQEITVTTTITLLNKSESDNEVVEPSKPDITEEDTAANFGVKGIRISGSDLIMSVDGEDVTVSDPVVRITGEGGASRDIPADIIPSNESRAAADEERAKVRVGADGTADIEVPASAFFNGRNDVSLVGTDAEGNEVFTSSVTFSMSGGDEPPSKPSSGSSGGCSAGFGALALSALAVFALRRK